MSLAPSSIYRFRRKFICVSHRRTCRGATALSWRNPLPAAGARDAPGDLNESFMIGPVNTPPESYAKAPEAWNHFNANIWPVQPANMQRVWTDYYRAMEVLADDIMRALALGLGLDEMYFRDKIDRHVSPSAREKLSGARGPARTRPVAAGAHSDYGSLTLLKTEDKPGGLQVFNKREEWVDVPFVTGSYIINIGELMASWTGNRWVSTLHRVVNPPLESAAGSRRQSIIYFHNPNYDAVISDIPNVANPSKAPDTEVLTAGEHLRRQFKRTQNVAA